MALQHDFDMLYTNFLIKDKHLDFKYLINNLKLYFQYCSSHYIIHKLLKATKFRICFERMFQQIKFL